MLKKLKISKVLLTVILTFTFVSSPVFAQGTESGVGLGNFADVCQKVNSDDDTYGHYPACANSPSACGTKKGSNGNFYEPLNCLFLEEPIGGETGYDLYKITCGTRVLEEATEDKKAVTDYTCIYALWHGEAIIGDIGGSTSIEGVNLTSVYERGPAQAILTYEHGRDTLLFNYLSIIYKFMSGIIVGFVVLLSIIGGIRMTISAGRQEEFTKGRQMITKALIGMVLWFLASLILYTINPTFFTF